jgi:hypothetical protein
MKIFTLLLAAVLLAATSFALPATKNSRQSELTVAKVKKPKKPKKPKEPKVPKKPPCACVCAGTTNSKWSCSPTGCSPKDGTPCSAGGPNQSPTTIKTPGN